MTPGSEEERGATAPPAEPTTALVEDPATAGEAIPAADAAPAEAARVAEVPPPGETAPEGAAPAAVPAAAKRPPSAWSRYGVLALLVIVGSAIVFAAAFHQEYLIAFWRQGGWNPGAAEQTVRRFVELARQPDGGREAAALLDPQVKPVMEGERLVAVERQSGQFNVRSRMEDILPSDRIQEARTELLIRDGGRYRVLVQFDNGKWAEFRLERGSPFGPPRLRQIPAGLDDEPLERNQYDY